MDSRQKLPGVEPVARLMGLIYAILHYTNTHKLLGFSLGGWFKNLPLVYLLLALLVGWSMTSIVTAIILAVVIRTLYWQAKKAGYIKFVAQPGQQMPSSETHLEDDEKVIVKATGTFSVTNWQDYVLQRPAEYWRVPRGDHAIMVEHPSGRYLYQFIQPGALESVEPGHIYAGTKPQNALAITFLSTWQSDGNDVDFMFYAPSKNHNPAKFRRQIYFTFDNTSDRELVWQNLLRDAHQPIDKEVI